MKAGSFIYFLFLCLIIFCRCGPKRTLPEPASPQPDWVISRPVVPGYYTGIGWAQKSSNVHLYQQTARQNALADLAGEISVTISTNSVLHAFESNLGFREDFHSTIQASTIEQLEGYEIAGTWEDQAGYWIYYRLSAERHREIKEKRRNDAVRLSSGLLENALENRDMGNFRLSLVQFINSLEAIRDYLDDPLPVEFRGRKTELGNDIFNELSSTISRIEITPLLKEIEIKRGEGLTPSLLRFSVTSRTEGPIADFPLLAEYSERPIRNNRALTGPDGTAGFTVDGVRSPGPYETFRVRADIETILSEALPDPLIRRLLLRVPVSGAVTTINILKPVMMIVAREENIGDKMSGGTLAENFRKKAVDAGYITGEDLSQADYIVRIEAVTTPGNDPGIYKTALLTGSVTIELQDGNIIFFRELGGFRGTHFDHHRAGEEAFRLAVKRMESSIFREINDLLRKNPPRQNSTNSGPSS